MEGGEDGDSGMGDALTTWYVRDHSQYSNKITDYFTVDGGEGLLLDQGSAIVIKKDRPLRSVTAIIAGPIWGRWRRVGNIPGARTGSTEVARTTIHCVAAFLLACCLLDEMPNK